jgi:hypothetical protein
MKGRDMSESKHTVKAEIYEEIADMIRDLITEKRWALEQLVYALEKRAAAEQLYASMEGVE